MADLVSTTGAWDSGTGTGLWDWWGWDWDWCWTTISAKYNFHYYLGERWNSIKEAKFSYNYDIFFTEDWKYSPIKSLLSSWRQVLIGKCFWSHVEKRLKLFKVWPLIPFYLSPFCKTKLATQGAVRGWIVPKVADFVLQMLHSMCIWHYS